MGPLFGAVLKHSMKGNVPYSRAIPLSLPEPPTLAPLGRGNHRFRLGAVIYPLCRSKLCWAEPPGLGRIYQKSLPLGVLLVELAAGGQAFCPGSRQQPPRETYPDVPASCNTPTFPPTHLIWLFFFFFF